MEKLIILMCVLLVGCATTTPEIQIKEVMVPQLYCPVPPEISKPDLPINTITETDDIGDVVIKYKATVKALIDYSESLESIILTYKNIK
jgi:hypothetical protein